VLLTLLGGALVRQRRGLWYDELYTAEVGTAGLSALARAAWTGTGTTSYLADVPPSYNAPYYAVVHLWLAVTRLPPDEVGLRLLSLLAAVGAVAVLVRAVQRLAGTAVALAAGLLAASSPLVVEYSAEGRMYGLALLAVATTALGLSRWLDAAPRGLLLLGVGGVAAGLMHWFALPVVAGLVLAAMVLRGRAALPVAAAGALAAVPCLALIGLSRLNGTGTSAAGWIRESESPVPVLALQAWTGGHTALLGLLLLATAAGLVIAVRRPQARPLAVVALCWTGVPLVLVQLGELVRPVFVPRYLLPALLGVALLTALGAASWRRAVSVPATAVLVAASSLATLPLLDRGPREDGRAAVAQLAQRHAAGEVVVAVDRRAALALEHYGPAGVLADVRVPPDDPPAGARVVWLLRQSTGERVRPSDDDELLLADGLAVVAQQVFAGTSSDLVLQRWER
jgi:mannosyltransferase